MQLSDRTVHLCRVIVNSPHLFDDNEKFDRAVRELFIRRLLACSDLQAVRSTYDLFDDAADFEEVVSHIADKNLKSLIKQIDVHYTSPKGADPEVRKQRLLDLASGVEERADDPKRRKAELKQKAMELAGCDDLDAARALLQSHPSDAIAEILAKLTAAEVKSLVGRLNPEDIAIRRAGSKDQRNRLAVLLESRRDPAEARPKSNRDAKEEAEKPTEAPKPRNFGSAAMAAEWDGIDRD